MGLLIGVGITLLATGLNELSKFYSSTTKLEKPVLELEMFDNDVYRVSALIRNRGNVMIKDAKAVMELERPDPKKLRKILVENCNECPP